MTDDGRFSELSPERRELLRLLLQDESPPTPPLRRNSPATTFPLSFVQERMWIAEKFTPAGAYTTCLDTRGRLDAAALARALDEVVRRHEILRSTFDSEAPVQTVHEPSSVKVALRDLRALPESTREVETRRLVEEESARPFDLVRGPLLRFSLLRLGEERHLLVISIHHLIFDGWSAGVFSGEVAALYEAFSRGQPPSLPELPIQYGDFARWQRGWAESDAVRAQVSYWKRQLGGELPPLSLPRDRPAPAARTFRSASVEFQLPPELHRDVERLSRDAGVTPFMTLLAAFNTVLHLSTGQDDIVVGTPAANRNPVQTELLIGCFMHPLVLRTGLSGEPSFRELLARTRKVCLEAYAHQDAPFEVVVREIRPRWDGRQMPLFQVLFNVQRARLIPSSLPGLVMTPTLVTPSSALDMTVHLWTGGDAIEGMWEYSTELFERATVEWLAKGYRSVLERVVEDADLKISSLGGWEEKAPGAGSSPERRQLVDLLLAEEGGGAFDRSPIPRLPRIGEPFEASFGQERLWFFEQLWPGSAFFNESVALRLEGRLEVDVLERTWQELLRRQESLRTSFVVEDGRPKQRVEPEVELRLLGVDLRGEPREVQEKRVRAWMKEEVEKPFDLSRAPLLRLVLLRLSSEEHVLVVTGHHIIADGWSGEVWQREMAAVYEAFVEGKESPLPELKVQYADYAVWQRERMRGPWVHEEVSYWKRTLGGELPVLELPVDGRRVEGRRRGRGETERFEIPAGLREKLRELGAREGTTLFMTLLAGLQTLLSRYTGEEDILVDTVLAGRTRAELEGLVGFFVNSAILRTDVSGNPTFRELLGRVKRVVLGALEHQEVPFDRVVSELRVSRRGETLTPVSFMLHEGVTKRREMGGVRVSPAGIEPNDEFDLTMLVWQEPEGLSGQLKYDRELFEPETIRRMAKHYVRVLEEVVREPEVRVGEIGVLTEEERREVLEGWNDTGEERGERECLHERFEETAGKRGESIAVRLSKGMREEGREYELSYGELEKRANQLARSLRKRGVRAETRVGLSVGRSLELAVGLLGILKSGGAYVPLDASQPRERLKKVLSSSGVEVVVTRKEERERLSELLAGMEVVEVEETKGESRERVESGVRGENAAYVMYTSGSTGEPKGVVVSHRSVVNHNVSVGERFGLTASDRVLQFHTVSFDAAVEEIFPTWMVGGTLLMRGEDPPAPGAQLANLIEEEELTVLNLPTTYWHEWVDESSRLRMPPPPPLRLVVVGGDQASRERYLQWRELTRGQVRWLNTYGPTETTVVATVDEPEREGDDGARRLTIGRPIANTQAYVLDGRLEPVPIGVAGELCIGGRGVGRGYHGRPDLTAEKFVADPFGRLPGARLYRTGDRARWLADGRIEFLGRVDRQFKLRGFRIEAGEIESALIQHPAVAQAIVRLSDGSGVRRLLAYIVVSSSAPPTDGDLRDFLRERLPVYMLPSAFVLVDAIPRMPSGKVDFRALSRADAEALDSKVGFVAPRTPAERELARIFSEVLGVAQVSVHDNFFQLGGDSIQSLRIVSRASNAGLNLSPKHFFQYQTIAELASVCGSAPTVKAEQGIVTGALPLTPIQRWFFHQRLAHPHRFIQSLLFELHRPLDPALLERVFSRLLEHHDALRMRFVSGAEGFCELNAPASEDAERGVFRRVDLRGLPDGALEKAIDAAVEESQASLDLSAGPLVRVSLIETGGRRDRLLVTIHHLIVDGVSWGILIEDLIAGYEQLQAGGAIELPPKTTSFREWSERLLAHAKSPELRAEATYWREVVRFEAAPLPRDFLEGENDLASADTVLVSLEPAETERLLRGAASAEVPIQAVLLVALARALRSWTGAGSFLVNVEGHGRVDLFEDVDVSRTVGWFTTLFPVRLTAGAGGERDEDLRRVSEELRGMPRQGIGYGLLSYLRDDEELERALRGADREISFNYLGQLDLSLSPASPLALAARFAPTSVRPSGRRAHLIDVNAMVIGGRLQTAWTYSGKVHRRVGIAGIAEVYQRELRNLLSEARSLDRASSSQPRAAPRQKSEPPIPRAPGGEMRLSFAQERLWFLDQLSPGSTLYNGQGAVRLLGHLELDAMRRSIQEIARRHEVLRTSFPAPDGRPLQVVGAALPPVPVVDLEHLPADVRETEARRRAAMEMGRPFDLTMGPLVRVFLFRFGATDHVLLFTVHHIAVDGWSLDVLIREVAALYDAFSSGKTSPLPELPIQYADYAIWQRQRLQGMFLTDELAHWREKLSALPTLDLPTDGPRPPAERRLRPAEERLELEAALWTSLRELMQRERATPFMVMLAAFDILLSRWCAQEDIAVGATVSNRGRPETQGLIGFFVNTLVLRTNLSGNPTFRELLRRVRETTFEALSHQELPFEKLVEELQPERDPSRTPLFQVFLNMVDAEEKSLALPGLRLEPFLPPVFETKFDLTLDVYDRRGRCGLRLAYNADLFEAATIRRMLRQLRTLLGSIAADPDRRLAELPLLDEAERRQVLFTWNDTRADYRKDACLHQLFEEQAGRTPGATAVLFENRRLTYRELDERSNQLAHRLRELGVGPDSVVGICAERSLELVVALYGILKAGAAYTPLDPEYPQERLSYMLDTSRTAVLLVQPRFVGLFPGYTGRVLDLDADGRDFSSLPRSRVPTSTRPKDLAYVLFTSGSTGQPKGVMVPHEGLCNQLFWMQQTYGLDPTDRILQKTPFSFDVSVWELFWPLLFGSAIVIAKPQGHRDPAYLVDLIQREAITTLQFVPSMLQAFVEEPGVARCTSLRRVICIGEALPFDLKERFFERIGAELHNLYGPTEASLGVTAWTCSRQGDRRVVPIGRPMANTETYVLDGKMQPVPVGVPGELYLGGLQLARGYLNRPELTAERFVPDPFSGLRGARLYRTGDRVRWLPDGNIEFLGRWDHQVKVRGFRIELNEIEAVLAECHSVREAAVVAREDRPFEKLLAAYVVPREDPARSPLDIGELRERLRQRLPEYMIPAAFVVLDRLPLTGNGKLDRKALPPPGFSTTDSRSLFVPPRNAIEQQLAEVWAEVLPVDRVGAHDNFFDLGGHSLLATQVVSRIRQQFGVDLPLRVMFDAPTVRGVAESVESALGKPRAAATPIPLNDRKAGLPLSFVQERAWITDQLIQGGGGSMGGALRLSGPLDAAAFERSILEIVRRHEVLRARFPRVGATRVLSVEDDAGDVWSVRDLRDVADDVREAEALRVAREEIGRSFDLAAGPLARVTLVRLTEAEHLLVVAAHHTVADGWSAGVFLQELEQLYAAYARGEPSPLPPLPIQYADYAAWQRAWSQGPELQEQLKYWSDRLSGRLPVLELPLDHPRPSVRTFRGATEAWTFSPDASRALAELSRHEGVTMFMTLLAGFQALLYGASGQEDIVIGSPAANRNHVEVEKLIGCFMHPLVLRTDLSGNPTFRQLLERVREVCLGAYAHQDIPFELVARALQPEWAFNQSPLFQVLFNVQREEAIVLRLPGLTPTPVELSSAVSVLDLSVHLWAGGTEIRGVVEYSTELFEASTIEWLGARYRALMAAAAAGPNRRLSELWAGSSVGRPASDSTGVEGGLSAERRELLALLLSDDPPGGLTQDDLVRRPRTGAPLPTSSGQERLWFFEQLEPGSAFFNESVALRLEGRLEVDVLERTWQELSRRQESLRTSFVVEDGRPKQRIESEVELRLLRVDLSGESRDVQEERVGGWMKEEVEKPFDLRWAPLLRLVLLRLSSEEHVLVVTGHHIIADGWSGEVWQREMAAVYEAFEKGKPSPLAELPIQYADYAVWQRERMRGPWVHEEVSYWKRALGGELPVLELPVDGRRVEGRRRGRGETERFEIPAGLREKLRELGAREGTTLFMTLLAGLQTLLSRYTGEEDILVDTVLAGRTRAELEGLVGFFVNSAILRTDVSGNPTFRELLGRVKRVVLGALEHQEVPFDRVVSELRVSRRGETLTPVSFMLHEGVTKRREMGGVRVSPAGIEPNDEFDLTMLVWQEPEGLTGQLKYDRELFEPETVRRMAKHYVRVLEEVVREPEVRVGEIGILTEEERREVLEGWNDTGTEIGERECLHERFEETAGKRGESIAVRLSKGMREEGREYELSYGELEKRANQLARSLRKRGVRAETRVGLSVGRSLELAVGLLGILKSGGAYVPLDASQPRERLKKVLSSSGVEVVVTRKEERERLSELLAGMEVVEVEETKGESRERVESGVRGENAAYVMYTSGSTGEPKGVVVSHRSVVNHNVSVGERFGLTASDRVLQFHTVSFDAAVEEIFPTWMVGGTLLMRGEELVGPGEELERLVEEEELTVLNLPTAYWHEWVLEGERRKRIEVSGLRLVVVGGDKASAARYETWRELAGGGVRWVNTYGPTETTVVSSVYEPEEGAGGEVSGGMSIGRPIGNTRMYVLDSRMEPVPVGVGGELWVGGAGVARGYLGRPELTAERFVADPFGEEVGARMYRTGDRARYLKDGRIEFLGRADEQVKIRGFRVEPAEVQSALLKHPAVGRAAVTGWKASPTETLLVAYVVAAADSTTLAPELRSFLQSQLPDYMLPSAIVLLESLPMTAGGKLDRRALPEPVPVLSDGPGLLAPRTPTEEVLAEIWADVLGVERVSIDDNFFELGGHSLKASELMYRVRESFAVDLPLRTAFESPTVAMMAASVDARVASGAGFSIPRIEAVPREGPVPLSYAQEGAWWVDRLEPGIPFNIPIVLRLEGDLRVEILEAALNEVVRRHEVLRTNFSSIDGEPVQLIAEHRAIPVPCVDLSQSSDASRNEKLLQELARIARTRFDLSHGPLLRMAVFRMEERDHVLLFTVHHSVFDGWSTNVLAREIAELYASMAGEGFARLPPLPVQYADYAVWQRKLLQGEFLDSQIQYWTAKLDGAPSQLNLPVDSSTSPDRLFRGASSAFVLPRALSGSLRSLGRSEGVTLYMLLLAAFKCLLSRYTGQEDLVVGTPVANRSQIETHSMIGFCVNLLALRTDLSGNPSFRALVKRVRETCLGAFGHQDLPFGQLVRHLAPVRDVTQSPIFQAQFALHIVGRSAFELPDLRIRSAAETPLLGEELTRLLVDATPANDPLFVHMVDSGEELSGIFHYRADLFEPETIRRMAKHYVRVLEEVVREPEVRVGEIGVLTEEERREVLEGWNDTGEERGERECLHERFEETAGKRGESIAVRLSKGMREEGREYELSYGELEKRANQLARSLRKRGVRAETRVGLSVGRSLELAVGLLGILKSGGAYVPLDASQPRERLKKVLSSSGVEVVVTRKEERESLSELLSGLSVVEVEETRGESAERVESGVRGENAAYVMYTSGSTGEPKGVVVSHRSVVNHNVSVGERFGLTASDRVLQFHTVSFDAAVEEIFPTWMMGGTLLMRGEELVGPGEELERLVEEEELTVLNLPTAYWHEWVLEGERRKRIEVSGLRLVVVGGDKASAARYETWRELAGGGVRWVNTYGPTETTVVSSVYEPEEGAGGEVSGGMSIGRPIGNTRMYVLDSRMEPVPVGVGGELWVGGAGVARGYLGRPELTAERFVADPFGEEVGARMYRTGDRARYLKDGRIEFLGRADEQVKIRGFRVEPAEIEAALKTHRGLRDVAVLGIEDGGGDKRLFAFVIAAEGEIPTAAELREFLNDRLPIYMVPAGFVFVSEFPSTPGGKIDRRALSRKAELGPASDAIYVEPRTSTEKELAGIWSELLSVERIGVHDDFFALGGHSLLAAKAVSRLRSQFQVDVSLRDLFLNPTVAGVAQAIDRALATGMAAPGVELDLEREAALDADIAANGRPFEFPAQPARVFLTGATGFVGASLLRELLDETSADVWCLVRADSPDDGSRKLRQSLEKYGLWDESAGARIVPVPGDLSERRLGLSEERFADLGRDLDAIYHNGAWVNALYPYAMMKAANVLGTQEVLRLACLTKIKPVHYVSTLSVFPPDRWASGVMDERWIVEGGDSLHGGYAQSKWVAERLVSTAGERGLPVSVYRLGRVSGDSRTGVWTPDPLLIDSLRTLLDLGSVPRVDDGFPIDLVPVDYVAKALVYLSRQPESLGKAFHLVNPRPTTWREFVDRLSTLGPPIRELAPERWAGELVRFARRTPGSFLHPLLPLLPSDLLARLEAAPEDESAPPSVNAGTPHRIDCTNTLQGLKESQLTCPPAGALLGMYLSHFVRSGMLALSE